MTYMQPYVDEADAEIAARKQQEQRAWDHMAAENAHKEEAGRMKAQATIAKYIADGDLEAMRIACHDKYVPSVTDCVNSSLIGRIDVLRRHAATPKTCREFGMYKGYDQSPGDVMSVGLQLHKTPSFFAGKVAKIEGRTLLIQNPTTFKNAMVSLAGTHVYNGSAVVVGSSIVGYGSQTEARQGRLASGALTSIPVIAAVCVGPD